MRIASYNIRKCLGTDRRRDPARICEILNTLDADVIALQEADKRLGSRPAALPREMVEAETDFDALELDPSGISLGFHGNALLVRRGLVVTEPHLITLPGTEPRGAVMVTLDGGTRLVAAHLGLLRSDRRRQLAHLAETLAEDDRPSLLIGDMNEWRPVGGFDALPEGYDVHSPGRTYHATRPIAALDRLALCPALRIEDAGVVETDLTRRASDHLPIWADISAA